MRFISRVCQSPHFALALAAGGPLSLKILTALMGLLFNYLAAQYLPADEFGVFSLAQVLLLLLVIVSKLGLENTLVKLIASAKAKKDEESVNSIYCLSLALVILSTLIAVVLVIGLNQFISFFIFQQATLLPLIPLIAAILLPNVIIAMNASMLNASRFPSLSLFFTGLLTLSLSCLLTIIFTPHNAVGLLQLVCIAAYLAAVVSLIGCIFKTKIRWQFDLKPLDRIRASCLPLWTASIVAILIQQFSTLVVARYVTLEQLGVYAVAIKIATLMSFVLISVNAIAAPSFAALFSTNKLNLLKQQVRHINQLLMVVAMAMFSVVYFSANWLMGLFGESFIQGAIYLKILAFGQMINVGTGSVVTLLVMTDNEKLHQRNILFIALLTIVLAFSLIPTFGAIGAALTTAIAMAVQNLVSYYFVRRKGLAKT